MIWQDSNPSPYAIWVELLTITPYIIIRKILFSFIFYYRKLMYILEHSRNFRSTPRNTIKGSTRHYFDQIGLMPVLNLLATIVYSLHIIYIIYHHSLSPFLSLTHSLFPSLESSISLLVLILIFSY